MSVLKRIQELFAPPVFEDEEQTRRASLLNVMLLASMLINVVGGLPAIFLEGTSRVRLLSTSTGLLFQLMVMVLLRRRRIRFASLLLCLGFWLTVTLFSFVSGGISSPLLSFYGVIVLGAGLLLGNRVGAGFVGLCVASAVTMYYFQEQAVLPTFSALTPGSILLDQIAVLISIAVVLYLALRSLGNTLERARSGERAQTKANSELAALRALLEERVVELERAEKSLRDSETLYHTLVENLPQSIFVKDLEGRFVFANQRFCDDFGKPLQDIVGRTDFDFHPPELAEKYRADDQCVMEQREILDIEEENQLLGGEKSYVHVVKTPTFDSGGRVIGIQGVFWDVTEHKRAEEILRQSHLELEKLVEARTTELANERNLLRTLIDTLPDVIYIKDTQSRIMLANTAQARLLGAASADDLVGKADSDFFPKELATKYYEDERTLFQSSQPLIGIEEPTVDPVGNRKWLITTKVPFRDYNGKIVGLVGMGRDITHLKQVEEELRESEARFRKLFEASPDAVVLIDANDPRWPIVDCNQVACQMNGYTREELIGQSIDLLNASATDPGERMAYTDPAERAAYLDRLRREGKLQYETRHRHKNGTIFPIEVSTTLITVGDKELVLGMDRDITERKRAEESLRRLSARDSLTGLYNRAFFEGELKRLEASRLFPVSIVMADVDELKTTNDREGHAAGDELLRRTAAVLGAAFRTEDIIARIGGDEFAVLLPQTNAEAVRHAVDRCRMEINRQNDAPFKPRLSLSIGAATAQKSENLTQTLQVADENMYQDKAARKDPSGER